MLLSSSMGLMKRARSDMICSIAPRCGIDAIYSGRFVPESSTVGSGERQGREISLKDQSALLITYLGP